MKLISALLLLSTFQTAHAFTEVITKTSAMEKFCPGSSMGDACLMNWASAVDYCQSQGMHLPTAREFVEWLKPQGIKVLETSEVKTAPNEFDLVESLNPDGSYDAFFMSYKNYRHPNSKLKNYLTWTASVHPKHKNHAHVFYEEWGGGGGDANEHLLTHLNSVRCAK